MNELLFDILVCEIAFVPSAVHKKDLTFITGAIWQIESEFAKNSRHAIHDFNKLVIGSAPNKLFIGPIVKDIEAFTRTLLSPALRCAGSVLLALVTHPRDRRERTLEVKVWQLLDQSWHPI